MADSASRTSRFAYVLAVVLAAIGMTVKFPVAAGASFVRVSFQEVAQTADLVFIGTVTGLDCTAEGASRMIFTHVHFGDIQVLHATGRSVQAGLSSVRLTHAGGKVGGRGVWVSAAPAFRQGRRYLVFALDDGLVYANPLVGGPQGQFEVIQDESTFQDYVLTADGRAVHEVGLEGVKASARKVDSIQGGTIFWALRERQRFRNFSVNSRPLQEMIMFRSPSILQRRTCPKRRLSLWLLLSIIRSIRL